MTQFSVLLHFQFPVIICLTLNVHKNIHHNIDLVTSSGKFIFLSATKKRHTTQKHGDNCRDGDEEIALKEKGQREWTPSGNTCWG